MVCHLPSLALSTHEAHTHTEEKIADSGIREFHIENDGGGEEAAENERINQD